MSALIGLLAIVLFVLAVIEFVFLGGLWPQSDKCKDLDK